MRKQVCSLAVVVMCLVTLSGCVTNDLHAYQFAASPANFVPYDTAFTFASIIERSAGSKISHEECDSTYRLVYSQLTCRSGTLYTQIRFFDVDDTKITTTIEWPTIMVMLLLIVAALTHRPGRTIDFRSDENRVA